MFRTWVLAMLLVAATTSHAAAQADGEPAGTSVGAVRLDALLQEARLRSPRLRAALQMTEAVRTREAGASLPPDPQLQLGVMNLSLPSLKADMPAAMAPSIQAMQMLPLGGKLSRLGTIAEQETQIAAAAAAEVWLDVKARVSNAFFELYATDRQLAVMRETIGLLRQFEAIARSMYAAGEGRQADVLRAGVEIARMEAELRRMETMRSVAAAMLNAELDRPAATGIGAPELPPLPAEAPAAATLLLIADSARPALARERLGVEQAATRGELMRREIWPDINVGVAYGQRAGEMGTERMGSVMLGFSVPVFAGKRQLRQRDEAEAMRLAASAELAGMRAMVDAEIDQALAELERARTLLRLYREDIMPQAGATVQSALASYRVGSVDFMTLVDAQMSLNRYRIEHHELVADYARAVTRLESAIGRELPVTTALALEAR